jgi:hypothetical protein
MIPQSRSLHVRLSIGTIIIYHAKPDYRYYTVRRLLSAILYAATNEKATKNQNQSSCDDHLLMFNHLHERIY